MGHNVDVKVSEEGDDWETDPDFEVASTSWIEPHVSAGGDSRAFPARFRTTCRSRSSGGGPRPSRGLDAKSTSGGRRTSPPVWGGGGCCCEEVCS